VLLVVDSLPDYVAHNGWRDQCKAHSYHEYNEDSVGLDLELFGISWHWEGGSDDLELKVRISSRLLQDWLVHELREERCRILRCEVQKGSYSKLLSQVVSLVDEVRPIPVRLEVSFKPLLVNIIAEFLKYGNFSFIRDVHIRVIFVSDIEGALVVER
jgi:hypothetical protein